MRASPRLHLIVAQRPILQRGLGFMPRRPCACDRIPWDVHRCWMHAMAIF